MSELIKIEFTLNEDAADDCAAFLFEVAQHGWEEETEGELTRYRFYLDDHPMGNEILDRIRKKWPDSNPTMEEKEREEWAMAWKDFFVPVSCGERFEVLPPWLSDKGTPDMTPILIEPKMAFGTGHHPTTALCLEAIAYMKANDLISNHGRFLDLGTGSGILGIGLCLLGLTGVGVDIDPQAVTCARENIELNKVDDKMTLAVGSVECVSKDQSFELVTANILSGPLIEMARPITALMRSDTNLILSGILDTQAPTVAKAYQALGLPEPETKAMGEWRALIFTPSR